jgi:hypothetical protein
MRMEELRNEWQLVLMGSIEIEEKNKEKFCNLLEGPLDWSEILFQLVTHRSQNIFYYNLKKFNLVNVLEKEIQRLLDAQWQVFNERNNYYLKELGTILKEFERYNLVVPIVKGNLLASKVYPAIESRVFNDLDLLIKLDDVTGVTKALEGIGYLQGHFDEEKQIVVEATRKEKVLQQVASHELQEFQKVSENKFAKLIQVDVNHDILWKGNCPYKVPTSDLISRAVQIEIGEAKGYMLDYIDNIIQLSSHLYKEATLMMWITDLRDLKIYKFADLFMYIRKFFNEINWDMLVNRVREYNIQKVVYYNFHYIEMMFGNLIPTKVLDDIRPADLSYLDEYGIENKEPAKWDYDFFTRLFDTNRVLTLDEGKCENIERFMEAKLKTDGVMIHRTAKDVK